MSEQSTPAAGGRHRRTSSGRVEAAAAEAAGTGESTLARVLDSSVGRNLGLVIALLILIVVGVATAGDRFASVDNMLTILRLASVIGVVSIGMTFVITGGGIDLSVGAIVALASVWATTLATQTMAEDTHWIVMVFVALAVGAGCGLVNGAAHRVRPDRTVHRDAGHAGRRHADWPRSSPSSKTQIVSVRDFVDFFGGERPRRPGPRHHLRAGRDRSAGCCSTAPRSDGARWPSAATPRRPGWPASTYVGTPPLLYVLLGLACGIAAVMIIARTTTGSSTHGSLYELDAIAAVVIGGTLLSGGRGTIVGTVLGVLIFTTLTNVFTLNNLDTSDPGRREGRDHRRRRAAAAARRRRSGRLDPAARPRRHAPADRPPTATAAVTDSSPTSTTGRSPTMSHAVPPVRSGGCSRPPARCWPQPSCSSAARATSPRPSRRRRRVVGRRQRRQLQRRPRRDRHHRLLRPGGRPRLAGRDQRGRQGRGREVRGHRLPAWRRAPTTPTCRSARSRRSSTTRSTRSCCCRPTARRSPTSPSRRWRRASRSSTSTASSPRRSPPATTILGDNYGMGVSAGTYACQLVEEKNLTEPGHRRDRRHRRAAADPGPLAGLRGRAEGVRPGRSTTASPPSSPSSPARRRRPTCCRPRRRSTSSGTTTTTRASASRRRSTTPTATSSSSSAAPARQRDALDPGRRDGGHRALPADPGRGRHPAGPADRAGQGHVRPGRRSRCRSASSSTRRWSPRTTSRSTCRSASSPEPTDPHDRKGTCMTDGAADPRGRDGRLRLHGCGPLAGLADGRSVLRPAARPGDGRAVRSGRRRPPRPRRRGWAGPRWRPTGSS